MNVLIITPTNPGLILILNSIQVESLLKIRPPLEVDLLYLKPLSPILICLQGNLTDVSDFYIQSAVPNTLNMPLLSTP